MEESMQRKPTSRLIQLLTSLLLTIGLATSARAESKEAVLHVFSGSDGASPTTPLILDQAGNLYGTTRLGGTQNNGTVFEVSHSSKGWRETVLYSFLGGNDGSQPWAGLVLDSAGNLYGTTTFGGSANAGIVFELSPSNGTWTKTTLYTFRDAGDGGYPVTGSLIFDKKGNLYGTTQTGGKTGQGTIFKLSPTNGSWKETVLYNFSGGNDGFYPGYTLVLDAKGNLYGTTGGGGSNYGIVYELSSRRNGKWTYSVLYTFPLNGWDQGAYIEAGVVLDEKGNIYGETADGNPSGNGVVFELAPNSNGTWSETVLHAFDLGDGSTPIGGLTFDKQGNLYGATQYGGSGSCTYPGCGVVFKLTPSNDGWTESTLYAFKGGSDGSNPWAGVILDGHGNVFGTTYTGGSSQAGTVFEVKP
jgi:uncharacterized repeat protein (TIGR03803 family)